MLALSNHQLTHSCNCSIHALKELLGKIFGFQRDILERQKLTPTLTL